MDGHVVMVTGGAGFLGQHIVKLLQEKGDGVREIRVFDIKPYVNLLGHEEPIPVRSTVGDLRLPADLAHTLDGVDAVIHTAGLVSFGTAPDIKGMEQVNVQGTDNLIEACVTQNVERLVFTSTIDVVVGSEDIVGGDETLPVPRRLLFPGYPDTKYRAEQAVLRAHGRPLAKGDGTTLKTLALRPNVMYGEGDPFYITSGLRSAKSRGGVLTRVGDGSARFQQAYVGNMAWGHVLAERALAADSAVGGHVFFLTDDTPLMNSFDFMGLFLPSRGYRLSERRVPYPLVYCMLYAMETALWLISPLYKVNLSTALCSVIYINHTIYFSRAKAEAMLGYRPIYDAKDSIARAMTYYRDLEL